MPQLDPNPWFTILSFSWLIFLYFLPTKIMAHSFPAEQNTQAPQHGQPGTWLWPWH